MSKKISPFLFSVLAGCSPVNFQGTLRISTPPCNYATLSDLPKEDSIPIEYRENVAFIKDVRRFGIEQLGLHQCTEHYTTFKKDEEAKTLYRLFVAKPTVLLETWKEATTTFENHTAFREEVDAMYFVSHVDTLEDEYAYYKKKGYDVYVRNTNNYNPVQTTEGVSITPSFFEYTPEWQAHTVLHEICHDSLEEWTGVVLPSAIDEPFCALVGYVGTAEYYKEKKGVESEEYKAAVQSFVNHEGEAITITQSYQQLQQLYKSTKSEAQKKVEREAIFAELQKVMNEEVDNARLWDKYPYVKNYPLMLQMYNKLDKNIYKALQKMRNCPKEENKALEYIRN